MAGVAHRRPRPRTGRRRVVAARSILFMRSKRSVRIIVSYVLSLLVALSLLVWWIVYVLQASARINQFAARLGGGGRRHHVHDDEGRYVAAF